MEGLRTRDYSIAIKLSEDETLVLSDGLNRFSKNGSTEFEDQAEQRILWDIEAVLEKELAATLSTD